VAHFTIMQRECHHVPIRTLAPLFAGIRPRTHPSVLGSYPRCDSEASKLVEEGPTESFLRSDTAAGAFPNDLPGR